MVTEWSARESRSALGAEITAARCSPRAPAETATTVAEDEDLGSC